MFLCRSLAILLLLALTTSQAQTLNRCPRPLQAPTVHYQAMMASRGLLSLPNREWNLLYQMYRNPCIELQYHGRSVALFSRLVIYGTCDYRRMFRFTARQGYYSCWWMDLAIWDPAATAAGGYRRRRVTEVYDIHMTGLMYSTVTVAKGNASYCIVFVPDDIDAEEQLPYSILLQVLRHMESNMESEPAEQVHCDCSNRSLVNLWLIAEQERGESSGWDIDHLSGLAAVLVGLMVIAIGVGRFFIFR